MVDKENKAFLSRICSFQEINLDFYFFNDNVYHFGRPNILPLFKIFNEEYPREEGVSYEHRVDNNSHKRVISTLITEMANRLFTVCAIFVENPYIQY